MEKNSLGEIIRTLRREAGLTQEELAEGICSPVSISRIENGNQMPSSMTLDRILEKLGAGSYQLCNIFYKNAKEEAFEKEADSIAGLISRRAFDEAGSRLLLLEKDVENDHQLQCFLALQSAIAINSNQNPDEIIDNLKKALELTKPGFDYGDFRSTLLSPKEANILELLVVALACQENNLSAVRLGEELMSALDRQTSRLPSYTIIKINLAVNLAQILESEKRFKEELLYIRLAEKLSLESAEQILLPEIEFIIGKTYHLLGDDEQSFAILKAVAPYMDLIGKKDFAALVRAYAKEKLNLDIQ